MNLKKVAFVLIFWGATTLAWSDSASDLLWDKLTHISSMSASFTQKINAKTREISKSAGTMAFERPGHFRWQTKTPMKQLLVADGEKFWLYDVDLEQVTVRPQTEVMGAAAGLFLGDSRARFVHDFKVTEVHEDKMDVFKLQATAKQANIQRMALWFEGTQLKRMDLYDQLGQRTAIHFKKVKNNVALSPKLFRFSPPAGVDVVEQ
ncbi:MAG: outer membrane lipoprotein chaperone LolA [Gammaproteobacteria bacterium]|nr:outer membrane lipoprotein chaperone LolA [Gammaproteobacteria bacterium]